MSEVITIPRERYLEMKREMETLRKTKLYKRLLEFEENVKAGRIYTRKDLGF
jgi:PHD/YefM family antitoxin component YafN of YafNO toxin-antitoxin module